METTLADQAIQHALNGKWEEAIKINQLLINQNKSDIDALNRLARAFAETGNFEKAKKTTENALKIDPGNSIALKCLHKYKKNLTLGVRNNKNLTGVFESFLEESGKTKLVELMNLGNKQILNSLSIGNHLRIVAYSHKVSIVTADGKYIGCLPDDLSARLKTLIKAGGTYQVLLKSVSEHSATVFIRETLNKTKNLSFPPEKMDYVTFTPPELVHKNDIIQEKEGDN